MAQVQNWSPILREPARTSNNLVQSLWIGGELSVLERLSIRSFLANGYAYDLYSYGRPSNLPVGAALRDASAILPESSVFQYRSHASYAGFANWFRYELLLQRGGWWVDTDVVCLRPLCFPGEYVFASEPEGVGLTVTNAVIKVPAGSAIMRYAAEVCAAKDPTALVWGETGSRLLAEAVGKFNLDSYIAEPAVFCPLPFREWQKVLDPGHQFELPTECHTIHLWNEMWRRSGRDKNAVYPADCFYENLKRRFAVPVNP